MAMRNVKCWNKLAVGAEKNLLKRASHGACGNDRAAMKPSVEMSDLSSSRVEAGSWMDGSKSRGHYLEGVQLV